MNRVRKFYRFIFILLIALIVMFSSACSKIWVQPIYEIELSQSGNKIDLPVELIITDEFRNAEGKSRFIYPIGKNLVHYSENLVRNVFNQPLIHSGTWEDESVWPINRYLLEPKFAFMEEAWGVASFSKAKASIAIEWKLSKSNGDLIWIETIRGEGEGITGNMFNGKKKQQERCKKALQNLFEKTQDAMLKSSLLRKLNFSAKPPTTSAVVVCGGGGPNLQ